MQIRYNDRELSLTATPDGEGYRIKLPDGSERHVAARRLDNGLLDISEPLDPASTVTHHASRITRFRIAVCRTERGIELSYGGSVYVIADAEQPGRVQKSEASSGELSAPMPGVVAEVLVERGQAVEAYQALAVVEAMKVMATVEAPFAGTIDRLFVAKGQQVRQGEPLVVVRPKE